MNRRNLEGMEKDFEKGRGLSPPRTDRPTQVVVIEIGKREIMTDTEVNIMTRKTHMKLIELEIE